MRSKLFILVPSLCIGGQERQAVMMAACMSAEYDVSIVIFSATTQFYETDCCVINLSLPSVPGRIRKAIQQLRRAYRLRKLRKKEKPIAVYSFGATANLTNVLSRKYGKTIVSVRQYAEMMEGHRFQYIYKNADIITCQTKAARDILCNTYPSLATKTQVVYNGYDVSQIRAQSLLPPDAGVPCKPYILALGRMDPVKGFRQLLRAFARLLEKLPDALLVLCGDGEIRNEIESCIDNLQLRGHVVCPGLITTPYTYMAHCSVFVLPSITEGCPNTLAEAMICGAPVIAADCKTGPRELLSGRYANQTATEIEYVEYGVLVPPFTSDTSDEPDKTEMLTEAMYCMLTDKALRKRYAEATANWGEEYSTGAFKKRIIALLNMKHEQ